MLLIRPWLRMNKYRLTAHHVIFFIFLISNVGGSLTPVGDPPLFLGYLKGVPFWWVAKNCWPITLTAVALLLAIFFVVDTRNFLRAPKAIREKETAHEQWRFLGTRNLFFLAIVLGAVFIDHPRFLREALMLGAAAGSWFTTPQSVHQSNEFNFHPIKEVAILFAGIFATMLPALDWLQAHASAISHPTPALFFWGSGALSSVLDNAPTYLAFLSAETGAYAPPESVASIVVQLKAHGVIAPGPVPGIDSETISRAMAFLRGQPRIINLSVAGTDQMQMALILGNPLSALCLKAISMGSVFFGANTYIGNGPNFMVKAIADQQKAHTPSFLGYVFRYTVPYMLPVLFIIWLLFFRG